MRHRTRTFDWPQRKRKRSGGHMLHRCSYDKVYDKNWEDHVHNKSHQACGWQILDVLKRGESLKPGFQYFSNLIFLGITPLFNLEIWPKWKILLEQLVSAPPLKLLNWISLNFVVMKDLMCRCANPQEIVNQFFSQSTPFFNLEIWPKWKILLNKCLSAQLLWNRRNSEKKWIKISCGSSQVMSTILWVLT